MSVNHTIIQLLYALQFLRFGIVFPLVPLLAGELDAGPSLIGVIVGMFSLFSFALAIPLGSLVDRYGIKRLLTVGVLSNIAGAGLLLATDTVAELVLAQIISGLAFLLHVVGCQAYISNLEHDSEVRKGFGQLTIWAAIGQTLGPFTGGLLVAHSGYQGAFTAVLAIALPGIAVIGLSGDQLTAGGRSRKPDPAGSRRLVQLISEPNIIYVLVFSFAVIFAVNLRSSFLPLFLRARSMSEAWIGLIIALLSLSAILIRIFFARICTRFGHRPIMLLSIAVVGMGSLLIPLLPSIGGAAIAVLMIGLGFGIGQPLSMLMLSDLRPPGYAGLTMGLRFSVIMLATLVSPVALGLTVQWIGIASAFYATALLVFAAGTIIFIRFE